MRSIWLCALTTAAFIAFACGPQKTEQSVAVGDLAPGVVARVGDEAIHATTVALIAREQSLTSKQALDLAISDALFASAFRERPDSSFLVEVAERAALGRVLLEQIREESKKRGPPSPQEVQAIVDRHWYSIDRPAATRTIHVVALGRTPEERVRARKVVDRLARAVANAKTEQAFRDAAEKVDAADVKVKVESLAPVARDGRVVPARPPAPGAPVGLLETPFAEAANALKQAGEQSGIVETTHGYHVIMMLDRVPAVAMPEKARRNTVTREALSDRARALESALGQELRKGLQVTIDPAARELTARVPVMP